MRTGLTPTSAVSTEALQMCSCLLPGGRRHQPPVSTAEQRNHHCAKGKNIFLFVPCFFFLFFFLNLQETFIHVKLYRNNSLFTAPPKSLSVTTSHLCTAAGSVPIHFLLQKPAGGQAGATPGDRAQPRSGEPRTAPAAPQKTSSVSVQDSTALLYPLKSPPGQRSDAGNRGVGSRGRCWCWGQRPHSGFAQRHQETSSFRACSIENEGLDGPKEFTNLC